MDTVISPKESLTFEADLRRLVETLVEWDRSGEVGRISALRTWWRPSARHIAIPVMGVLVGHRINHPVWTVLPALFALHPLNTEDESFNLGATCRRLAGGQREIFASRFRRVLACDEGGDLEEIIGVLRWLAPRAQLKRVPINYLQLGIDLNLWRHSSEEARAIKLAWAREYYWIHSEEESVPVPPS